MKIILLLLILTAPVSQTFGQSDALRKQHFNIKKNVAIEGYDPVTYFEGKPLKGDPEVSRVHALLTRENDGRYWIVSKGRNPLLINGREVPREERTEIVADQKIAICTFILRIQPR